MDDPDPIEPLSPIPVTDLAASTDPLALDPLSPPAPASGHPEAPEDYASDATADGAIERTHSRSVESPKRP